MKPPRFSYVAPESVPEALALLAEHVGEAKVLAGGQSLVPLLNLRLARPTLLVDVGCIAGLARIEEGDRLRLGAATTQGRVMASEGVLGAAPLVVAALRHVGHPATRARGTVGGSLAHADPAAELPAVALALDAEVVAASAAGTRTIGAEDLFVGPFTTALRPDELLVELVVPVSGRRFGFAELSRRHGDFALAGAACTAVVEEGRVREARIALFGVAPTAVRAREAESALEGREPDGSTLAEAGRAALASIDPWTDVHASAAYRRRVTEVLVRRALAGLVDERETARAA